MYGQPPRFGRPGGGRGAAPPPQPPLPHFNANYVQNHNFYLQTPNFPVQVPNFPVQTPNIPIQNPNFGIQNPNFAPHNHLSSNRRHPSNETLEKIDKAVEKARRELTAAGQNVSALKVSQSALVILQAESWESLGFQMQQIPSLYRLMLIEGKINAFIHCFVAVWRITTLSDLEAAICKNEGVQHFEELELGPLVRHPLVIHYFCVNSCSTEVFRISSEEIISCLVEFMDARKAKEVKADELLDFIAKKHSVTSKEKLHVRIQSLGMHIAHIRKARQSENAIIKKCLGDVGEKRRKRPLFMSQKKQLDENFSAISERIKSFSSGQGKHVRFVSSSSGDDNTDGTESDDNEDDNCSGSHSKNSSQVKNSSDRVSSCPYPSASEELTRLGILSEKEESPSLTSGGRTNRRESVAPFKNKRKSDKINCTSSTPHKLPKIDGGQESLIDKSKNMSCHQDEVVDVSLTNDSMRMFITTWKEACRENDVSEVLHRMLQFYKPCKPKRRKKEIATFFSAYPYIGLLNVAVKSIKNGMWDSMYDNLQTFEQQEEQIMASEDHTNYVSIEVEPAGNDSQLVAKHGSNQQCDVSVEDILKKVSEFFRDNHDVPGDLSLSASPVGKIMTLLKRIYHCEVWVTEKFVVQKFGCLGYGDFITCLERHVSLLPPSIQKCFVPDGVCEKLALEARVPQQLLEVLLAQASCNLLENENLSVKNVAELLTRQFPSICFQLVEGFSVEDFLDVAKAKKSNLVSKSVLFSAALSVPRSLNRSSDTHVSTKDAVEVLLRAPMLADLDSWSHWDLLFAPCLGPLMEWLLNELNTRELLCLVTRSGNIIRIDHTATVDSFLEAFIHGSSFQTAVKLLSLFALYGGERNVPLSLLKCHTEKALEVIMKNSMNTGVKDCENHLMNELNNDKSKVNKGISYASAFFLDCLTYLPVEFRCFAADLLLSGFRSIVKDAPSAILSQCRQAEHLLMLHELGLSLGIMEWINDHHTSSLSVLSKSPEFDRGIGILNSHASTEGKAIISVEDDVENEGSEGFHAVAKILDHSGESGDCDNHLQHLSETDSARESAMFIESIRQEEFGLDPNISVKESCILKKQHARLGRALHCLSQELYSQDSHFLLELVQNADDNAYPCNAEPTLTFILQEGGIVVLNNELGFSAENIKALCDVGNSTKKESSAGYIGKKGIGFKSVFRVTDAPEIHSNGFHIKFDISEGQIGFVLPTVVPPCDIDLFSKLVSATTDPMDKKCWNTCIVLPFRSKKTEVFAMDNIISMFSDLHPSLLLFLHRLECIMFKNLLNDSDSLIVMRKEVVCDGIVNVSLGKKNMTWFVKSHKLRSGLIRHDVQTTEISIALMLEEVGNGNYIPKLDHQPVFAFLPLRNYGLKFIIQADFILPSSREEVDKDSPWNQWLLSEFPNLFVSAERSFCSLPCFEKNPGKGVSAFMSFVPLGGEVHGFFSSLPRMIISKLRMSNCLLLEGDSNTWVPPCKVLRNWTDQTRSLLPDALIREHLGLGYLDKDTVLTDSLAQALGIEEYGPRILVQIMTSLCHSGSLKSMGYKWLSSWLNALYLMAFNDTPSQRSLDSGTQPDVISTLRQLSFIPLLDGKYTSVDEGAIWLHTDSLGNGVDTEHGLEAFGKLYPKLRIVSPALFSDSLVENLTQMLHKVGVQHLSAHEVLKVHILPAISDEKDGNRDLMIEYLSFIMFHLQSSCPECTVDREHIVSEVRRKALILTNHGYKRLIEVPIHFSRDFGSPIDMSKLVDGNNMKWFEVDTSYLKHPVIKSISGGMLKWRKFLQELGVTDFVQIVQVEKSIGDISHTVLKNVMSDYQNSSSVPIFKDWESQELVHLLSHLSSNGDREKCKYLLEVLDILWDDYFSDKLIGICSISGETKPFKSSLISIFHGIQWLASTMDDELHYAKDLFHDCEAVRSVLGGTAPYAIPKVHSVNLLNDIGLRNTVTLDDALSVLHVWRRSKTPFRASISQMSKFYSYIWNEMSTSKQKILETLHSGAFIFVPYSFGSSHEVVPGLLLSPKEVYWHDTTGSMEQLKSIHPQYDRDMTHRPFSKMLSSVYPGLHYFFVKELGITENPPLLGYLDSLLQLSTGILPSQAARTVFQVFQKWADGLESGLLSSDGIEYLKKRLEEKEMTILPTVLDKWVSLHQSFGLLCWSDDEKLKKEFKNLNNVDFLYLGEHNSEEKQMLQDKVSVLFQRLGIRSLSEVVTREAIYYGPADSSFKTSLVSWALPYAQRYIYNVHPNEYSQLKLSGFKDLNRLRIVVVEKLFYRNVIMRFNIESKKRFECCCLLQDNILYTTRECDSHSLFMELSRFLVVGVPELHLANFLHMITTMVESGSTEEQMEFFIMNSQKLQKLPTEESEWSLQSAPSTAAEVEEILTTSSALALDEPNPPKSTMSGNNSSWPPANWRTAPGFKNALKTQAFGATQMNERDVTDEFAIDADAVGLIEANADWIIEENLASILPTIISEEEALKGQLDTRSNMDPFDTNIALKGQSDYGTNIISSDMNVGISSVSGSAGPYATSSNLTKKDQLYLGAATPQQVKTGKLGEVVAFKYFCTKVGEKYVKWVNEVKESGLPYDIVVKGKDKRNEYVEVKATTSARKDWFVITVREWQFAIEKGDSFSIARVVLSGEKSAQVTIYKDPVRLCQLGQLQLAILSPK